MGLQGRPPSLPALHTRILAAAAGGPTFGACPADSVAQLAEQLAFNQRVVGSSPTGVTSGPAACRATFFSTAPPEAPQAAPSRACPSCPGGEIGRHAILRGWCEQSRAGSSPVPGTESPCKSLTYRGFPVKWYNMGKTFLRLSPRPGETPLAFVERLGLHGGLSLERHAFTRYDVADSSENAHYVLSSDAIEGIQLDLDSGKWMPYEVTYSEYLTSGLRVVASKWVQSFRTSILDRADPVAARSLFDHLSASLHAVEAECVTIAEDARPDLLSGACAWIRTRCRTEAERMNAFQDSTPDVRTPVVSKEVLPVEPASRPSNDKRRKFTDEQKAWVLETSLSLRANEPDNTDSAHYKNLVTMYTGAFGGAATPPSEPTVRRMLKASKR